ncbi:MAG TPA: YeeE/YedE family protein [Burkholderiales bacterium]|nr:YeeE/YedE family protein [Burkholderiales bacterium]
MESAIHVEVLLAAFVIGGVIGAVATKTNFCTLGAVSDWVNMGHTGRMRAWVFAMAVALAGVMIMETAGWLDLGTATFPPYRTPHFAWLRYIVGGLMFGAGMTLASGCGSKTLIRIGGGNLKSIVALVAAAGCAYLMMWTPLFERVFVPWIRWTTIDLSRYGMATQEMGSVVAGMLGVRPSFALNVGVSIVALVAMLVYVFRSADFRESRDNILGGLVIGLSVAAGWYVTGGAPGREWKAYAEMATDIPSRVQTQSFTFISPMGDTVHWLLGAGNPMLINFGMAGFAGVMVGALLYTLVTRKFRYERFVNAKDFGAHALGGALMGIGGVLAMGCTIGQGITGVSTLAMGSLLAFFSMVIGAAGTMKYQYWRLMQES